MHHNNQLHQSLFNSTKQRVSLSPRVDAGVLGGYLHGGRGSEGEEGRQGTHEVQQVQLVFCFDLRPQKLEQLPEINDRQSTSGVCAFIFLPT